MRRVVLLALLAVSGAADAQSASQAPGGAQTSVGEVTFQFARPAATLRTLQSSVSDADVPALPNQPAAQVHELLAVSPAAAATVFAQVHSLHAFARPCASKAKGIADTGTKTLRYRGPDGTGSCVYNYSENKAVVALTDFFQGMEVTLQEGRKLKFFHRYDRLSLGAEMDFLYAAAQGGQALEMGNIAAELKALADDTDVLERVRSHAATLLLAAEASGAVPKP